MTNEKIILNAVYEQLTAEQRHEIAAAVMSPEQLAALAAQIVHVDKDGNETRGTIEEAEALTAAGNVHTFDYWKKEGKSVKFGEKHIVECYLWKFTTKPSRAQREAAAEQGKEAAEHPHFYPTKSHLFSCLQVESSRPAPKGRFSSTAEIIAYNKKLAAERKAAKAAAETAAPVVAVEEHHELPALVHAEPLPTKKAAKKPRTTKAAPAAVKKTEQPAAPVVDLDKLEKLFGEHYSRLYRSHDDDESHEYREAVKEYDDRSKNDPAFHALVDRWVQQMDDFISSDREAAAFVMALHELEEEQSKPEMVPGVQQLDFESIAANLLA